MSRPGAAAAAPSVAADGTWTAGGRELWAQLAARLRPHRGRVALAIGLALAQAGASLAGPALVGVAVDAVRAGEAAALDRVALALLAVLAVTPAVATARIRVTARVGEDVLADLRTDAFRALLRVPLRTAERAGDAAALSRLTVDVDALATLVREAVPAITAAALLTAGTAVALVLTAPELALIAFVWVPVVVVAGLRFRRVAAVLYPAEREAEAAVVGTVAEDLAGLAEVQGARREADRHARLGGAADEVVRTWEATTDARNRFYPVVKAAQIGATASVLAAGALLVPRGTVTVGGLAAALLYLAQLLGPLSELLEWLDELSSGRAALARIAGLAAAPSDEPGAAAPRGVGPVALPARGALRLERVVFGYDGPPVLRGVDLEVAPGERVALVGETGAGKTTAGLLVARVLRPDAGRVTLGGVDLAAAAAADVRRRVLLVAQEGALLGGTVADALRLAAPSAPSSDLRAAVAALGAGNRLADLDAPAAALSAGERELLGLARVVLADPAVVVLDEATARLDPATEEAVEAALRRVLADRAVLVVAHRLATALRADRVAVLEGGEVVECGPPAVLATARGPFARLLAGPPPSIGSPRR